MNLNNPDLALPPTVILPLDRRIIYALRSGPVGLRHSLMSRTARITHGRLPVEAEAYEGPPISGEPPFKGLEPDLFEPPF